MRMPFRTNRAYRPRARKASSGGWRHTKTIGCVSSAAAQDSCLGR